MGRLRKMWVGIKLSHKKPRKKGGVDTGGEEKENEVKHESSGCAD